MFRLAYRHSNPPCPPNAPQIRSFFSRVKTIAKYAFSSDDHVNPKKILERRYIYLALLAMHFRSLRLKHGLEAATDSQDLDRLYEQAVNELDAKDLDRMTNVQLRQELQNALQPQVLEVFQAFHRVDERLSLQEFHDFFSSDGSDAAMKTTWDPLLAILAEERADTLEKIKNQQYAPGSGGFFDRKRGALETLLKFHESGKLRSDNSDLDDFGINTRASSDQRLRMIRYYQTLNLVRSALIRQELGYSVVTLLSNIAGAGRGAFLDGTALAGSIVAFQPGEVWPKEHLLTSSADVVKHFEGDDDCQVSLRFDEYVVDSREAPVTVLTREGTMNPWALGHIFNHPPAQLRPNALSTALNYTERMKLDHLIKYIPNTYAQPPGWQSRFFDAEETLMHGLCLTASVDSCNEELLYDYRLQSHETPSWYSVVEYGDDVMDDDQVVFFRDDWIQKDEK